MIVKEFLSAVSKLWLIIVASTVILGGFGAYSATTVPQAYQSTSLMIAKPSPAELETEGATAANNKEVYPDAETVVGTVDPGRNPIATPSPDAIIPSAKPSEAAKPLVICPVFDPATMPSPTPTATASESVTATTAATPAATPAATTGTPTASPTAAPFIDAKGNTMVACDTDALISRIYTLGKQARVAAQLNTVAVLGRDEELRTKIIDRMGVTDDKQRRGISMAASVPSSAGVIQTWATANTPEQSLRANAEFVKALKAFAQQRQLEDPNFASVESLGAATEVTVLDMPKPLVAIVRYIAIGFAFGLLVASCIVYFRNRVLTARQVTEAFALPAMNVADENQAVLIGAHVMGELRRVDGAKTVAVVPATAGLDPSNFVQRLMTELNAAMGPVHIWNAAAGSVPLPAECDAQTLTVDEHGKIQGSFAADAVHIVVCDSVVDSTIAAQLATQGVNSIVFATPHVTKMRDVQTTLQTLEALGAPSYCVAVGAVSDQPDKVRSNA